MRNPIWILNSGLALIFFLALGILALTKKKVPSRASLVIQDISIPTKQPLSAIDVSRIYENDLFRLYVKPPPIIRPDVEPILTIPPAPSAQMAPVLMPPRAQFLDPLQVTLKGVITSSDENDNRAVIHDNKTSKEELFAVGDTIEDAEIIKILRDKVIFIRSNGQQETLFLTQESAAKDPIFTPTESWKGTIKKLSDFTYIIDPEKLKVNLTSVASFIDALDITTSYEGNIPTGCRIGQMKEKSIGFALGLQNNDILDSINGIPTSTTKNRVTIYQAIKNIPEGNSISVKIKRGAKQLELNYIIQSLDDVESEEIANTTEATTPVYIPAKQNELIRDQQIADKVAMKNFGGKSALLQRRK